VLRPDLFVWDAGRGSLTRVTHGGNVRQADPAPDGRSAAAVRCDAGTCHLVRVELATGAVSLLRAGTPDTVWTRPRWSPDGRRLVAGVQAGGRWRVVVLDAAAPAAPLRPVGPADDAERYDGAFAPDGRGVVYVSEAGGVPNLVRAALDAPRARRRSPG
jgi:TolB protein